MEQDLCSCPGAHPKDTYSAVSSPPLGPILKFVIIFERRDPAIGFCCLFLHQILQIMCLVLAPCERGHGTSCLFLVER
jgi:hypothetical protein